MTRNPVTIPATATVSEAIERIGVYGHSTYPVVGDHNHFIGLVTEVRLRRTAAEGGKNKPVQQLVDSCPHVRPEYPLVRAAVRMDQSGSRQLAVLDKKNRNKLVGLLTMSDIVRAHAQAAMEAGDPDSTVAPDLLEGSDE